jgi:hypothetical protein
MRVGDVGNDHADKQRTPAAQGLRCALRGVADLRSTTSALVGAERLITADTVEIATPARLATSLIVDTRFAR